MTTPIIEFLEVSVRYEPDEQPTLADVTFSVAAGERVALIGLNGSGKTTLLMAAVGLVPHRGGIVVDGIPLGRRTAARIRDRVGFLFNVPEDQLLFPRVADDVAFGLLRRGASPEEARAGAQRALESLGIGDLAVSPVHHLSHGQKQRVALAGALAAQPSILLLDEPSAGLDPPGKRALARLLSARDAAMIIATHDLEFARRVCSRYLVLRDGRIALTGNDIDAARSLFRLDDEDEDVR
ncbi:MAG TPA: ABC transporter ATP-binding protein [Polyangia bacterium]|nr:ABC transporter ATP-binding protein [Polyangia bacterium]